jgi:hypothetical protein
MVIYVGKRYGREGGDWRSPEAYEKYKERNRIKKKKKYDQIASLVNKYKLERGCAHCGYKDEPVALDFHHENREDKIINVSSHWKTSWKQYEKMKEEMKKCIVLCSNCHRIEEKRIRNEN